MVRARNSSTLSKTWGGRPAAPHCGSRLAKAQRTGCSRETTGHGHSSHTPRTADATGHCIEGTGLSGPRVQRGTKHCRQWDSHGFWHAISLFGPCGPGAPNNRCPDFLADSGLRPLNNCTLLPTVLCCMYEVSYTSATTSWSTSASVLVRHPHEHDRFALFLSSFSVHLSSTYSINSAAF